MDLVSSSMGIHSMRKYRDKIYQRIQERRALYTADETRDRKAASAYNVTGKKGLEKKRHELEREAAIKGEKTGAVRIVAASSRRSKNDTIFREAQYGLGERIQATEDVGDQRRLEAMEMMEEYREADQAHKKNVKALLHNVEAQEVFKKSEVKVWECRNCGHIVVGEKAPEVCPVCAHPQAYFEIHAENY